MREQAVWRPNSSESRRWYHEEAPEELSTVTDEGRAKAAAAICLYTDASACLERDDSEVNGVSVGAGDLDIAGITEAEYQRGVNPSSSVRIVKNAVRELNPFVRVSARTAGKLRPHYLGGGGQPRSLTLHRTTRGTLIPLSRTCYIHANRRKLSYGGESHTFIQ